MAAQPTQSKQPAPAQPGAVLRRSGSAPGAGSSAAPAPVPAPAPAPAAAAMRGPRKLLSATLELNLEDVVPALADVSEFTVIGVLGMQGVGKSTLMSLLGGAGWAESPSPRSHELHEPPFAIASVEQVLTAAHATAGIDLHVTPERLILLDVQPVLSPSVLLEMQARGDALPADAQSHENLLELHSLRLAVLLLCVCHHVVVVHGGHFGPVARRGGLRTAGTLRAGARRAARADDAEHAPARRLTPPSSARRLATRRRLARSGRRPRIRAPRARHRRAGRGRARHLAPRTPRVFAAPLLRLQPDGYAGLPARGARAARIGASPPIHTGCRGHRRRRGGRRHGLGRLAGRAAGRAALRGPPPRPLVWLARLRLAHRVPPARTLTQGGAGSVSDSRRDTCPGTAPRPSACETPSSPSAARRAPRSRLT